ncbi:MAG: family 20 glycosylhydrolase [Bacteroidia bacterium]|nr:family 20 glycosylhydrolase [Bacteroidia bacterium]
MKIYRLFILIALPALLWGCSVSKDKENKTWVAMHFLDYGTDRDLAKLGTQLAGLSGMGVNTAILEVDYHFSFESHPELRQGANTITKAGAAEFASQCRKAGMRLFIEFQCLGHQSWAKETYPLLTVYPELDLTPGVFPENEGLYCREWDPTNPKVNEIVFALLDELIKAFTPDGIHVGMDEVFLLGSEKSPNTKGMNPANLYARVVNEYHDFIVKQHGLEMMMWGDRLIDAKVYNYGDWEASSCGTAPAIESIPKDIIIADWHYELRETYPSIPMFLEKGFRVLPTSWKDVKASNALLKNALSQENPKMLGILFTAWSQYDEPMKWPPLVEGLKIFK